MSRIALKISGEIREFLLAIQVATLEYNSTYRASSIISHVIELFSNKFAAVYNQGQLR